MLFKTSLVMFYFASSVLTLDAVSESEYARNVCSPGSAPTPNNDCHFCPSSTASEDGKDCLPCPPNSSSNPGAAACTIDEPLSISPKDDSRYTFPSQTSTPAYTSASIYSSARKAHMTILPKRTH